MSRNRKTKEEILANFHYEPIHLPNNYKSTKFAINRGGGPKFKLPPQATDQEIRDYIQRKGLGNSNEIFEYVKSAIKLSSGEAQRNNMRPVQFYESQQNAPKQIVTFTGNVAADAMSRGLKPIELQKRLEDPNLIATAAASGLTPLQLHDRRYTSSNGRITTPQEAYSNLQTFNTTLLGDTLGKAVTELEANPSLQNGLIEATNFLHKAPAIIIKAARGDTKGAFVDAAKEGAKSLIKVISDKTPQRTF